ncbi:lipopolysaccharide transport system ATP-binding protein [Geodermatophilus amargosae]|uniref:Lipopolysaccharide transport system ATP-binding protein n=1 Tax=Geodermatophilus amargosae TaxID=1296565 RepID=A0A1I6X7F8_9ACTN|nr:ABC transporter ATP-binding protein [Geodermatophilus amargosae]SFT33871.1 lipopolysaccharide transport system ATP-binding protein [Geodermatophilus amargosae]
MPSSGGSVALRVNGLGKRYELGERESYVALRDVISRAVKRPLVRSRRRRAVGDSVFWALRDVSFEVPHGEALAIVGRNGAGKSTLLKILTRITEPTEGEAVVAGRVGALLEVGTGFHPELTGRENVTLNGAILGMRRQEIQAKFDEIVDFAGVERFVDTPVKRYSSGMRARLAFAVAAFLETDILVVDEVLAVGDAEFQKKCMGKMGDAADGGRTVLFVSHNMTAVESLCKRAVWLDGGRVVADGPTPDVVGRYLSTSFSALSERSWPELESAPGNDAVRVRRAAVRPEYGSPSDPIDVRTPVALEFEYWNLRPNALLNLSVHIYNAQGVLVFNALPYLEKVWQGRPFPRGLYRDTCHIPGDLLNDGTYRVELMVVEGSRAIYKQDEILVFEVRDDPHSRDGWFGSWEGAVRPQLSWETEQLVDENVTVGLHVD